MTEESVSLKGNVLLHPSFATPHDFPGFLRSATIRVVAGTLLLSGIFVGCVALVVDDPKHQFSCALSCATSLVAFYHYTKLISIREQTGTRVTLSKPGDIPTGQTAGLKAAWIEMAIDSVRYSDWVVTLAPLIIDLHILNGQHTALFPMAWSPVLCTLMVIFGSFTRIGTDELVPPSKTTAHNDTLVRVAGLVSFILSSACLFLVLYNLLYDLEDDPSEGWAATFSLPWIGYGLVTLIAIVWRQFKPEAYPEALSVFKDIAFGTLDIFSKANFAFYIGSSALQWESLMFSFWR